MFQQYWATHMAYKMAHQNPTQSHLILSIFSALSNTTQKSKIKHRALGNGVVVNTHRNLLPPIHRLHLRSTIQKKGQSSTTPLVLQIRYHPCLTDFFFNFLQASIAPQFRVECRKKEIHPQFYTDAKVYCNNELVMTTGGTKKEYVVDVWSGNHPFYLGSRSASMLDADQVDKFRKKYAGLDSIMEIPVLKGEIVLPTKRKAAGKGKKK